MKNFGIFLQIIVIALIASKSSSVLSPNFKTCPLNSPNLADCVIKKIEELKPSIATGDFGPNLKTDVNLTKFELGDISLDKNIKLHLTEFYGTGFNNFKIEKLRINPKNFKLDAIMYIPHGDAFGKYTLGLNLGILNLQGKGDMSVSMDKVTVLLKFAGSNYFKNGIEHIKIDSVQLNMKNAQIRTYFDNLFNGQKTLEQATNEIVNQNIEVIKGDVLPIIEQRVAGVIQRIANQVFASGTHQDFFPHN